MRSKKTSSWIIGSSVSVQVVNLIAAPCQRVFVPRRNFGENIIEMDARTRVSDMKHAEETYLANFPSRVFFGIAAAFSSHDQNFMFKLLCSHRLPCWLVALAGHILLHTRLTVQRTQKPKLPRHNSPHLHNGKGKQEELLQLTLAVAVCSLNFPRGGDWGDWPTSQFILPTSFSAATGSPSSSQHGSTWRPWTRTSEFQEQVTSTGSRLHLSVSWRGA